MFDTMKVAKRIKMTRIEKNMTQMQLADAMGVSYQAVSNWERGNSMPDISKLEDLCNTLDISVAELLGMEAKETMAVEKALQQEPLTVEELTEIAPMLPPAQLREQTAGSGEKKKKWNLEALVEIAPFLDEDILEDILKDMEFESLVDLIPLAPFLDEDILDRFVRRASVRDKAGILSLAPFLDEDTLDWVVRQFDDVMDWAFISDLAPFLDEDTIDTLVDTQIRKGNVRALSAIYPFMEEDTLRKVAKALMTLGDPDAVKEAMTYL